MASLRSTRHSARQTPRYPLQTLLLQGEMPAAPSMMDAPRGFAGREAAENQLS